MKTTNPTLPLLMPLVAGVFFSSLFTHGTAVEVFGMALTFFYCLVPRSSRNALLSKGTVTRIVWSFVIVTVFFLWFVVAGRLDVAAQAQESAGNNYRFFLLLLLFAFALASLVRALPWHVITALKYSIIIHDIVLLVQTTFMLLTNKYLDMVAPFTGEEARYRIDDALNPILTFRATGMFIEPSHFSATLCVLAIGYIVLCRSNSFKVSRSVIFLTALCVFVTQSTAGAIQGILLLASMLLLQNRTGKAWTLFIACIGALCFSGILIQYFDSFLLKLTGTADIRFALLGYIYNTRRGWDFIFGFGPFGIESNLWQMTNATKNMQVASLNDAGLLNYFVVQFGIMGLAIPIGLFLMIEKNLTYVLFFCLVMTTKLSYVHPILYMGMLPLLMSGKPTIKRMSAASKFDSVTI